MINMPSVIVHDNLLRRTRRITNVPRNYDLTKIL